jgi:hypothetical protein
MTGEVESHQTNTEMIQSAPLEVQASTEMPLKVRVSCSQGCILQAGHVTITDSRVGTVQEIELTEFGEAANDTDEFVVRVPSEPGAYRWTAVFPAQEKEGILHEESSTTFFFTVKPHLTSIAVWDIPSPVACNAKFKIKVGVKCSAQCNLTDKEIRVYGVKGKKVATRALGCVPWPGTSGLYWSEVELEAPGVEGSYRWRVKFTKPDLDVPHEDASDYFGFTTARPPEHVVTVEVIEQETKAPIKNAHVVLRPQGGYPYRGHSDETGVAKLAVPKGEYDLVVLKDRDYETFETTVEVADEVAIKAALLVRVGQW